MKEIIIGSMLASAGVVSWRFLGMEPTLCAMLGVILANQIVDRLERGRK